MKFFRLFFGYFLVVFGLVLFLGFLVSTFGKGKPINGGGVLAFLVLIVLPLYFGGKLYLNTIGEIRKTSYGRKDLGTAYVLLFFYAHRFYLYGMGNGLLYFFTFGGFGFWWLYDILTLKAQVETINSQSGVRGFVEAPMIFENQNLSHSNISTTDRLAGRLFNYIAFIAFFDNAKPFGENIKRLFKGLNMFKQNPNWGYEQVEEWWRRECSIQ
jgi:TM2 domain